MSAEQARYRNISYAVVAGLSDLLTSGAPLTVRGQAVREIRNYVTTLDRPAERCLFLPHRGNNIVASLVETLWVLAGRDDIAWLSHYLPRASEFSDDGTTWRAAYGPRLRNWNGVDQLRHTQSILLNEANSRRAAISLFDPDRDFVSSKDIPCNNWLQLLLRDGHLHMTIGARSTDAVWGFSGINSFEWSVLHSLMARSTNSLVGDATYLATSFHLYEYHHDRAQKIVSSFQGVTCYDYGLVSPVLGCDLDNFDDVLKNWFSLEQQVRSNPHAPIAALQQLGDEFLASALDVVRVYSGMKQGWSAERVCDELAQLSGCDLVAAMYELVTRKHPDVMERIPDRRIAQFLSDFRGQQERPREADNQLIVRQIKTLHERKNAKYGTSWKKKGELISILANVARKVDRLSEFSSRGIDFDEETVLDTSVDLFVYTIKYRLYLLEQDASEIAGAGLSDIQIPLSESIEAFNRSVEFFGLEAVQKRPVGRAIELTCECFEHLYDVVSERVPSVREKLELVTTLARLAFALVCSIRTSQLGVRN